MSIKETDLSKIVISDSEVDEYVREQIEGWDMDSLVQFAIDMVYDECIKMDRKELINQMHEYYGDDWFREKKLTVFK